jgi:hypothetical protein
MPYCIYRPDLVMCEFEVFTEVMWNRVGLVRTDVSEERVAL